MSIGFTFTAKTRRKETLIQAVSDLAEQNGYGIDAGEDSLRISLCPMGELTVGWKREGGVAGQWLVSGECCSTPAGAGLHKAAVELVDGLKDNPLKDLSVADGTDYYDHRDFRRMQEEHFYRWLNALTEMCRGRLAEENYGSLCLCWDMDEYQPENIPDTLITPVGRFSVQNKIDSVKRSGIKWFAGLFFLWDQPERDARYYRNSALNLLWEKCRFVPSSCGAQDMMCNHSVLGALETAARLDSSLPLPLSEYREICVLDGREPSIPDTVPELRTDFPIGFRKGETTHTLGVLRIVLPGTFEYEWEEDGDDNGCHMWSGPYEDSPVWRVTGFRKTDGEAELSYFGGRQDLEHSFMENGELCWGWQPVEENGGRFFQVFCEAVSGPCLFLITVTYFRQEDREDIYSLIRKLKTVREEPPERHAGSYGEGD